MQIKQLVLTIAYPKPSKKRANLATHHFKAKNSASDSLSGVAEFYYLICCKRQVELEIQEVMTS